MSFLPSTFTLSLHLRFVPRIVAALAFAGFSAFAESAPKKIIFLAGESSHGYGEHEYWAGCLLLCTALNEQKEAPVEAEVISGWPRDESVLDNASEIVVYDSSTKLIGKHWEKMDALAKAGKGLTFLHYAVHPSAAMGEKYYRPWIGGAFESGFSVNPFWIADLQPLPSHPVSNGITSPIRAFDEFYYNMRFAQDRAAVLDLATATPSKENVVRVNNLWTTEGAEGLGKPQTLMWGTVRPDGGRGVGFSGGHYHRNWAIDDYRKLVLNAIVWCAGIDVPKNGVASRPLNEADLSANLSKKTVKRLSVPVSGEYASLKREPIPTVAEHQARLKERAKAKQAENPTEAPKACAPTAQTESTVSPVAEQPTPVTDANLVPASAFEVPDDLEVTVWASTPMLFNPTNMDTDRDGRIWVAEGVNYRRSKNRRPEGDRIVVLEDSDGDGKADKSSVFVQDPELVSPLGISVFGNKIVVAQPPHLIVYTDVDGNRKFDPKVDKRENLLSGFMGWNHDHSLHAVVGGPDGRWYFNHGNTGADFTTRDGVNYRIGGPYDDGAKIAGAKSADGRVYTGGFAASMNPDGTKLRMLGHGFRNSYEHCLTSYGDIFQNDNDDPPACRTTWLMEGGFLGFFSRSGKRTWEAERRRGQSIPTAQWRQEDPGTLPPGDVYGRGAPTGIAFYENGALPAKYRGLLLSAESRLQTIFGYYPKEDGAGKKMERFNFLQASADTQFRPSDVMVGADGAIYIADWFDLKVGGHGTQDTTWSGTIYRIAPKGFRPAIQKAETAPDGKLTPKGALTLLQSPAPNARFDGLNALKSFAQTDPVATLALIDPILRSENPYLRARAAWLLPFLGATGAERMERMLDAKESSDRILALRCLRNAGYDFLANAKVLDAAVQDRSPAVRREAAVLLRELNKDFRLPLVETLFSQYDGKDRVYLEACGLAAEGIEEGVWKRVASRQSQNDPLQWSPRFARITWRLQPTAALPALLQRAKATSLSMEERRLAVDTIAFTRSPEALLAMRALRHAEPSIAEMATSWLLTRATDEWESFGGLKALKDEGLYDPDSVVVEEVKLPVPPPRSTLPDVSSIMKLEGNADRGKNIATRCTICHRIGDQGVDYGPDLKGWAANQGTEAFLRAVIDPSESIALGFEGERVPLIGGKEVQGILLSASDPITVRSTGGLTQMIPRRMLDKRTAPLRRSLMMSAQELGLTAQDLADLAAFMKSYQ